MAENIYTAEYREKINKYLTTFEGFEYLEDLVEKENKDFFISMVKEFVKQNDSIAIGYYIDISRDKTILRKTKTRELLKEEYGSFLETFEGIVPLTAILRPKNIQLFIEYTKQIMLNHSISSSGYDVDFNNNYTKIRKIKSWRKNWLIEYAEKSNNYFLKKFVFG